MHKEGIKTYGIRHGIKKVVNPGKTRPARKFFLMSSFILLTFLIASPLLAGCDKIELDFFGHKFGKEPGPGSGEQSFQDTGGMDPESNIESDKNITPDETGSHENDMNAQSNGTGKMQDAGENTPEKPSNELTVEDMRLFFSEGVKNFQEESYLISEYYFNKIKDHYFILQDHTVYYLAKSLLMQEKYPESEECYSKLISEFPESIWFETSNLEYADLLFIQQDYIKAEGKYSEFLSGFPVSEYCPYALFQLAACQEKNSKLLEATESLKELWLQFPTSSYAGTAYDSLVRIIQENSMETFIPTPDELYNRGELLFKSYMYADARREFGKLLEDSYNTLLTPELYCKVTFRIGMCYYNQGDYGSAKDYLLKSYEKSNTSSVADDCLYYLGRAYTNLNDDARAISYYNMLLNQFPSSNYGDDAYYRMGRIYSISNDSANAQESFQKVFEKYPSGDMTDESLWELGWIQYKKGDFSSAGNTFANIATSFKGSPLEEKGLYWEAKCQQKQGNNAGAIENCRKIISLESYSYYTFAARFLAEEMGNPVDISGIDRSLNPQNPAIEQKLPDVFVSFNQQDPSDYGQAGHTDHIGKAIELMNLEFYNSATLEINAGSTELEQNPDRALKIATIYYRAMDYGSCLKTIYKNQGKIKSTLDSNHIGYSYYLYYPYAFPDEINKYSSQYRLDPLFLLAVIRQESAFVTDAGSYAGAQGLMQIMPATAEGIASRIGISSFDQSMLHDPDVSINMGAYYLRQQLENYNQDIIYCLGAYNGGPGAMSGWVSKWGDRPPEEFIEYITYLETKEYIKKVLGNYYFYQMLYG